MTVSFFKRYLLADFNPETDLLVVLRRYDDSDRPWGVHRLTIDLTRRTWLRHQPIGLFSTDQVQQMCNRHHLAGDALMHWNSDAVWLDDPTTSTRMWQLDAQVERYIWTQVVPMEWHGKTAELGYRVLLAGPANPSCWLDARDCGSPEGPAEHFRYMLDWVEDQTQRRLPAAG